MADVLLAMAHRPLHLSQAPIYQATKPQLDDISDSDSDPSEIPPNFDSPPRYQHFSALRTTDDHRVSAEERGLRKSLSSEEKLAFRGMNIAKTSSCEECALECKQGACQLELTEQCTDQCVIVPCNDPHHGYTSCEVANALAACDVICTDGPDCNALDTIVSGFLPSPS
jgi:hypothetical protein